VNAQSIRVLDYSKEPFVVPSRPTVPTPGTGGDSSSSDSSVGGTRRPPSAAFANWKVNKRRRLDDSKETTATETVVTPVASGSKERLSTRIKGKAKRVAEAAVGDVGTANAKADAMVTD
jgi:hypothetical protein